MGTNNNYFKYFNYRKNQKLEFSQGEKLNNIFDVVIGSDVQKSLNYKLQDNIIIAHGLFSILT